MQRREKLWMEMEWRNGGKDRGCTTAREEGHEQPKAARRKAEGCRAGAWTIHYGEDYGLGEWRGLWSMPGGLQPGSTPE